MTDDWIVSEGKTNTCNFAEPLRSRGFSRENKVVSVKMMREILPLCPKQREAIGNFLQNGITLQLTSTFRRSRQSTRFLNRKTIDSAMSSPQSLPSLTEESLSQSSIGADDVTRVLFPSTDQEDGTLGYSISGFGEEDEKDSLFGSDISVGDDTKTEVNKTEMEQ